MSKKPLQRIYRTGKLSAKQATRDEDLRHKIQAEFPPLEAASDVPMLSDVLKQAITHSRKSVRQLAKEAQVSAVVLQQFLAGQRDLRLTTAEKLVRILGLKLVAN